MLKSSFIYGRSSKSKIGLRPSQSSQSHLCLPENMYIISSMKIIFLELWKPEKAKGDWCHYRFQRALWYFYMTIGPFIAMHNRKQQ